MGILAKIFTWWDGATIGTLLFSRRHGSLVGEDSSGNRYFQAKDGKKRWVIYNGANDAARVAPEWHGWLHGTFDGQPESYLPPARKFELDKPGNPTGSDEAYRPKGAIEKGAHRAKATGDYTAWSPDAA
jgi:NADH:ubiquinone oxidoreductase subunit